MFVVAAAVDEYSVIWLNVILPFFIAAAVVAAADCYDVVSMRTLCKNIIKLILFFTKAFQYETLFEIPLLLSCTCVVNVDRPAVVMQFSHMCGSM